MRALLGAFAVLLAAGLAACGSSPGVGAATGVQASCSGVAGAHHAFVIVEHANGKVVRACAGFDGATVSGFSLMKDAHLEYQTQSSQYGPEVCQVDSEPAHYDKCLASNAPYWANWQWNGSAWTMAQTGYAVMKFTDHQALGWVYTPPTGSPAPPPPPPSGG